MAKPKVILPDKYCPRCGELMVIDMIVTGADADGFWTKEGYVCTICGWEIVPGVMFVP